MEVGCFDWQCLLETFDFWIDPCNPMKRECHRGLCTTNHSALMVGCVLDRGPTPINKHCHLYPYLLVLITNNVACGAILEILRLIKII